MDSFETTLAANLYRLDCPDSLTLGEYQLGELPAEDAGQILAHVRICPNCTRELNALQQFLVDVQPAAGGSLVERARIWIAQRLPRAGETAVGQPAFAVRGDDAGPLMYEAGEVQLTLEVRDDPDGPGLKSILGLLFGAEPIELTALLWQDGRPAAETAVNDLGNFVFHSLSPGVYDLILTGADLAIHVQDLTI